MASIALGITGLLGAGASLFGASQQSDAAQAAAQAQEQAAQQGLAFQQQIWNQEQQNQAPFIQAGQTSVGNLMSGLQSGQFGPGAIGAAPTAPTAPGAAPTAPGAPGAAPTFTGKAPIAPNAPGSAPTFTAPTAQQAAATPGYQFTADQGNLAILRNAAATGGVGGGTLKSLERFGTGLANSTYNDVFNRALSGYGANLSGYQATNNAANQNYQSQLGQYGAGLAGYGANLSGYQASNLAANQNYAGQLAGYQATNGAALQNYAAQLSGYGAGLAGQQQGFQQAAYPAALGEGAVANLNQSGQQASNSVAQLMAAFGNAKAAGDIGSANAWSQGIGGVSNSLSQTLLLQQLLGGSFGGGGGGGIGSAGGGGGVPWPSGATSYDTNTGQFTYGNSGGGG